MVGILDVSMRAVSLYRRLQDGAFIIRFIAEHDVADARFYVAETARALAASVLFSGARNQTFGRRQTGRTRLIGGSAGQVCRREWRS